MTQMEKQVETAIQMMYRLEGQVPLVGKSDEEQEVIAEYFTLLERTIKKLTRLQKKLEAVTWRTKRTPAGAE